MLGILFILMIMFGPPIILSIIGSKQTDEKKAKTYKIIAAVYLIIGLGVCGSIIYNL